MFTKPTQYNLPEREPPACNLSRAASQGEKNHLEKPRSYNCKVRGCLFRGGRGVALRGRSLRRSR